MAVYNALERAMAERTNSLMQSLTVDPDVMSDAEDEDNAPEEDEQQRVDDLFNNEGVRKKLELLAQMVGVDSSESEPGVLLAAVVRVIKDLKESFFSLECTETDHNRDHFF